MPQGRELSDQEIFYLTQLGDAISSGAGSRIDSERQQAVTYRIRRCLHAVNIDESKCRFTLTE